MLRRTLLTITLVTAAGAARAASPGWALVSAAELQRDRAAAPPPQLRGLTLAGGPAILVDKPANEDRVPKPFSFRIRFRPSAGAAIDLATFRATYGWLAIDITSRLLDHAKLTATGLMADNIDAPTGEHRVTLSIADTAGRVGSRTFRFTVV